MAKNRDKAHNKLRNIGINRNPGRLLQFSLCDPALLEMDKYGVKGCHTVDRRNTQKATEPFSLEP